MRPFKIAVAGSHSTGKTSFLQALEPAIRAMGYSVAYVHDSAAEAQKLGFPILSNHTFASTAWLMARAIEIETHASLTAEVILVDRPVHDALGYLVAALKHTHRSIDPAELETLEQICTGWAREYDIVLLTEIDPAVPLGLGRDADLAFRQLAGECVGDVVETYFQGHWQRLTGESHDQVLALIGERLHRA